MRSWWIAERTGSRESRATLRALLREYSDKTSQYLNILREDLNSGALALREIMECLGDTDAIRATNSARRSEPFASRRAKIATAFAAQFAAAKTVENCLASVRKRHQLSVSQLMIEIRMLHKRIDRLESGASVDMFTHLFPRKGMEQRIREGQSPCQLLLIHAGGIVVAASQFGSAVAEELTDAVIRRLRNVLPAAAILARWSGEGFLALLEVDAAEAAEPALRVAACPDGRYVCVMDGKAVHSPIQPEVRLLEPAAVGAEEALREGRGVFGGPGVC